MRIKISFSKNLEKVPNNQDFVNSFIHTKCLNSNNEYHDKPSDYCISRLLGGIVVDNGKFINYPNGGYLLITSLNHEILNKIMMGIMNNPEIGFGMKLIKVEEIKENFYNGLNYFKTTNVGFILRKRNVNIESNDKNKFSLTNGSNHYFHTINDENINNILKDHIINKFSKINPNLDFSNLKVEVVKHKFNRVKNLLVKNVVNTTNICQIVINTNKKLAEYIYNYGIGQSTGSGFGTIYSTQFIKYYE